MRRLGGNGRFRDLARLVLAIEACRKAIIGGILDRVKATLLFYVRSKVACDN